MDRNQSENWRRPRVENDDQNKNYPNQNQNWRWRSRVENNNQNENNGPNRDQQGWRRHRPENENNNLNQNHWRRRRPENNNQTEFKKANQNIEGPKDGRNGANQRKDRNHNDNLEVKHPIRYKTLQTLLETTHDSELILKLSSKMNGFLLLLDQRSINPDLMCLILAALAKASKTSTELSTVQLLVYFFMEILPKLSSQSNFYRELIFYITEWAMHCEIDSSQREKHIEAIENLLIFLRRLLQTIYQKSFDTIRNLMQLISAQVEFINRKGNAMSEFIVTTMNQLNNSVENFQQMRDETEVYTI